MCEPQIVFPIRHRNCRKNNFTVTFSNLSVFFSAFHSHSARSLHWENRYYVVIHFVSFSFTCLHIFQTRIESKLHCTFRVFFLFPFPNYQSQRCIYCSHSNSYRKIVLFLCFVSCKNNFLLLFFLANIL